VGDSERGAKNPRPGRQGDILAAFTELVAEKGYDMTSVAEIATHLQLSKGTIMYHFGSKDQMLREMSLRYMRTRLRELELIIDTVEGSDARIQALILSLVTSYRDDRASSVAFSREFMRFAYEPVMSDVRALRRLYVEKLEAVLEQGMADGLFRKTDARIVALQIIGMCNWTWTWYRPQGRLTCDAIASVFAETTLAGLLSDPGRPRTPAVLPAAISELRRKVPTELAPAL
jgi:TetR/AcrR family transcriptional regulator, cholesterol catabolism regulator